MSNPPRSINDVDPLPVFKSREEEPAKEEAPVQETWTDLPGGFRINQRGERSFTPEIKNITSGDHEMINRDRK